MTDFVSNIFPITVSLLCDYPVMESDKLPLILSFTLPSGSGCGHLVGRGTRFNAHKSHVGNYMSSKIYEFIMKCRSCAKSVFRIRTNPALQSFDYIKGIQKRSSQEDGQQLSASNAHLTSSTVGSAGGDGVLSQRRAMRGDEENPIDLLDRQAHGQRQSITELQQLEALQKVQMVNWKDDAANNATLRAKYRMKRNAKRKRQEDAIRIGLGRGIELPEKTELLSKEAKVSFAVSRMTRAAAHAKENEQKRFFNVRTQSIFWSSGHSHGVHHKGSEAKSNTAVSGPNAAQRTSMARETQYRPTNDNNTSLSVLADYSSSVEGSED